MPLPPPTLVSLGKLIVVYGCAALVLPGRAAGQGNPLVEAREAFARGEVPKAVSLASVVLERDPANHAAASIKVEALSSAHDWETALSAYDAYVAVAEHDDGPMLAAIGRAVLHEATLYYPTLRRTALGRLACAGDREALVTFRQAPEAGREDKVQALLMRAHLGEFEPVLELRTLALSGPAPVRIAALKALVLLRDRGAEAAVLDAMNHQDTGVRVAAARASRQLALAAAEPALRGLLGHKDPVLAAEAAAALATLGVEGVTNRLEPLLGSPVPELRLAALAGTLARGQEPAALAGLRELALSRAGSAWVPAVELLLVHDVPGATLALRSALEANDPGARIQAIRLLAQLPGAPGDDLAALRTLLHDLHPLVRIEAASALAGSGRLCAW